MSPSASSNSTDTITNVVFGITATTISVVTVWQGHRVWKMWREHARVQGNVTSDIELGLQPFPSTPTSLEAPERVGVVGSSALSTNQSGDAAESHHISVSTQRPELQTTLPTAVDAETRSSPALVQGARIDSNEVPGVHDDVQSALTDTECQELGPAANDHL